MKRKLVICDIDNTILINLKRKQQSIKEVTGEVVSREILSREYDIQSRLLKGKQADKFYDIFLSDKHIHLDESIPHSANVLNDIVNKDYVLVYLTGRHDSPNDSMKKETLEWLKKHGFPVPNNNVRLFMKEDRHVSDDEYKNRAIPEILSIGRAIVGIGDTPDDATIYSKYGIKPVIFFTGFFSEGELKVNKDVIIVDDWREIKKIVFDWVVE